MSFVDFLKDFQFDANRRGTLVNRILKDKGFPMDGNIAEAWCYLYRHDYKNHELDLFMRLYGEYLNRMGVYRRARLDAERETA